MRRWPAWRAAAGLSAVAVAGFGGGLWLSGAGVPPAFATPARAPALCEDYGGLPPEAQTPHAGMVRLPGGRMTMGSDVHYAEEARTHEVTLDGFWIDRHDVTNAQFARFVEATGYLTVAERMPDLARHPDLPPAMRVPGSAVFIMPAAGRQGHWRYVAGANWRHPEGPGSDIRQRANHPVVHVAYEDALAYARWLGRELPTEAQWEYAARGGLEGATYVWGNEFAPKGQAMANTWEGPFPMLNTGADGYAGTAPVGCFAPNGFGLYDMAGNVWQWTATWYRPAHPAGARHNPAGPAERDSIDPRQPGVPAKVIKGGSHLCSADYCMRYRPAARQARETDSGTSHIGFRTVVNLSSS